MSSSLVSWRRDHFEPGGGEAYLYYTLYGDIDISVPLSRSEYRSQGAPDYLKIFSYGPDNHPEIVKFYYDGVIWQRLEDSNPQLASTVRAQTSCLVLQGIFEDPDSLDYLRDTVGLIAYLLDRGAVAVLDLQTFSWFSPQDWKSKIFAPEICVPTDHVIILDSADETGNGWLHTRGMRKFGRPDISIRGVAPEMREGAIELCNRMIALQAFGGLVPEGKAIEMEGFPSGYRCFHRGDMDDPNFNNVHITIEKTFD